MSSPFAKPYERRCAKCGQLFRTDEPGAAWFNRKHNPRDDEGGVYVHIDDALDALHRYLDAPQPAQVPEGWQDAVRLAYGYLWHVNTEPLAPVPLWTAEQASHCARAALRGLLTTEERRAAISEVRQLLDAAPKEPK